MLERILPAGVAVADTRGEILDSPLHPEELAAVEHAVEKRRREFTTARACARAALAQLGLAPRAIPSGTRGAPLWPEGIVGSITHCDGYRAAAVARREDFVTLGIDAERDEALPGELLGDIALPQERASLARLGRASTALHWDRLLFSIKEAVYKAWYPLTESWLGFEDAVVEIEPDGRRFVAHLLIPGPRLGDEVVSGFSGRWLARDGVVLAAIARPPEAPSKPSLHSDED